GLEDGGVIECTDCDPACDIDGIAAANGVCVFPLAACANVPRAGCRTAPLKSVKVRPRHARLLPPGPGEACGLTVGVRVRARGDGARPGRLVLFGQAQSDETPRRTDRD